MRRAYLAGFALLAGLLLVSACGRKVWPEPRAEEDRFNLTQAKGVKKEGCLFIEARVEGAVQNLRYVSLQLAVQDDLCEDCPFKPEGVFDYYPGGADMSLSGDYLKVTHCGLDKTRDYLWRLAGRNSYLSLGVALSPVMSTRR